MTNCLQKGIGLQSGQPAVLGTHYGSIPPGTASAFLSAHQVLRAVFPQAQALALPIPSQQGLHGFLVSAGPVRATRDRSWWNTEMWSKLRQYAERLQR